MKFLRIRDMNPRKIEFWEKKDTVNSKLKPGKAQKN